MSYKHYVRINDDSDITKFFSDAFEQPTDSDLLYAISEDRHFNLDIVDEESKVYKIKLKKSVISNYIYINSRYLDLVDFNNIVGSNVLKIKQNDEEYDYYYIDPFESNSDDGNKNASQLVYQLESQKDSSISYSFSSVSGKLRIKAPEDNITINGSNIYTQSEIFNPVRIISDSLKASDWLNYGASNMITLREDQGNYLTYELLGVNSINLPGSCVASILASQLEYQKNNPSGLSGASGVSNISYYFSSIGDKLAIIGWGFITSSITLKENVDYYKTYKALGGDFYAFEMENYKTFEIESYIKSVEIENNAGLLKKLNGDFGSAIDSTYKFDESVKIEKYYIKVKDKTKYFDKKDKDK